MKDTQNNLQSKNEMIDDLKTKLWKHHEDYAQGITQDSYCVSKDCYDAANVIETMQSKLEYLNESHNALLKEHEEFINRYNRIVSEQKVLKECIVRMVAQNLGVNNEH